MFCVKPLDELRLERGAERLHELGPHHIAELLGTLCRHPGAAETIFKAINGYLSMRTEAVKAAQARGLKPRMKVVS